MRLSSQSFGSGMDSGEDSSVEDSGIGRKDLRRAGELPLPPFPRGLDGMIPANSLTPVSKASCPEVGASLVSLVFEFSNNHLPSFSGPESQAQPGQPEQSQARPEPIPTFPRNSPRVFLGFPMRTFHAKFQGF